MTMQTDYVTKTLGLKDITNNELINGSHLWGISAVNKAGSIGIHHHPVMPTVELTIYRDTDGYEFPAVTRYVLLKGKTPLEIRMAIRGLVMEALKDSAADDVSDCTEQSYGTFSRADKNGKTFRSRVQTWNIWSALHHALDQLFNELPKEEE